MNRIQKNVLLGPYTTFKIGGPAKYFTEAKSIDEIQEVCQWAKNRKIPFLILGAGSNILIPDKGFGGLVIKIQDSRYKIQDTQVQARAGAFLPALVTRATEAGLSGLEWASGIPGTVGGAVAGNSGAFGKSISDIVEKIEVLDVNELRIKNYELKDCDFGYRHSVFKNNPNLVALNATFNLQKEKIDLIKKEIRKYSKQRKVSFTLNQKCAGCFFKNVEWKRTDVNKKYLLENFPELKQFSNKSKIPIGFIIDFVGLKGKTIGNAKISDEHANFILNLNNANAEQILMLVSLIKDKIYSRYGFVLEEEVNLVGF